MNTLATTDILTRTTANFEALKALKSLAPSTDTNRMFGSLVTTARSPMSIGKAQTILAELDELIGLKDLHTLCAQGEFALEQHWAERINNATNPKTELRSFPYWTNYVKLAKLEVAALRKEAPEAKKILFVGAGPLPLTAYMFATHYKLDVTNLELDESAAHSAQAWMEKVMKKNAIPCIRSDVMDFTAFQNYDVVVLAALVGLSPAEKHRIVEHLHAHMSPHQLLMVRSVRGLRALLYPIVKAKDLQGFNVVREVHPRGEVVNSVVLARKTL